MDIAVSIIGTGHCGCAFAAGLLHRGIRVLLYAHPDHSQALDAIQDHGSLSASMLIEGDFRPVLSRDIEDAVRFSNYLIVTVPAYGHDDVIAALSGFDLSRHVVVCITGTFFSLAARQALNAASILETSSSPYASRIEGHTVKVMGVKAEMPIASLSRIPDTAVREGIARLFPMPLQWLRNVLEIGFSCITAVIHPAPALMNAGWIESTGGDFYFYRQGMTPSVAKVMEGIDRERLLIATAFGSTLPSAVDLMNSYYHGQFRDLGDFANRSAEHNKAKMAPASLRHRFIAQDVPYVLVPWYGLGRAAGIEARTIHSVIQLASLIHNVNYMEAGRTPRKLGLQRFGVRDILAVVAASPGLPGSPRPNTVQALARH